MPKSATKVAGRIRSAPIVSHTPAAAPAKKAVTSLHIEPETLADLKKLAADRRRRVNDLVIEAIKDLLDRERR